MQWFVQDLVTQWIQSYPCKIKSAQVTQRSLRHSSCPEENPRSIYTDKPLEFVQTCEELNWNCERSTPHRSGTNGIAERAVRRAKEGTSSFLLQSGLRESWWAQAMECQGPIIPIGAEVKFFPISAKDQRRVHQFSEKVFPGIFMGYALNAGGEVGLVIHWKSGYWRSEIHVKRFKSKEVDVEKRENEFVIPLQDWRHVARMTVVIHRCVQSGWRPQANLRDPSPELAPRQDSWSIMEDNKLRIMLLQGRNSSSEGRFSDTSELYRCSQTNKNENWCTSRGDQRWLVEHGWRTRSLSLSLSEPWIGVTRYALLKNIQVRMERTRICRKIEFGSPRSAIQFARTTWCFQSWHEEQYSDASELAKSRILWR